MDKTSLRRNNIELMKSFMQNQHNKQHADQFLANHFFNTNEYNGASRIGIVLSMPHEVDTYPIIKQMLVDGKQVFVPETNYQSREMVFKHLDDLDNIAPDDKGINHVNSQTEISNELDLLVVPGVAFNNSGFRVGYGGGYFDKFLNSHHHPTLSLIYDFQLCEFEVESHDRPVEKLIIATTR
ncbi:5-formyltetrahydrofolate cyclo-ligase [Staphylococcus edaphicus]|uniref:5-formyltetrahydrofolate cyclo-ligase n=1 Tax=Staphylococcus edaphicus TaxID=1955013 RepID=A0A2C6WNV7_9STAP|nr:5-formyltetrahydrofolate cyclo-ligase [Staphylococcus edaphicus]PHK49755.1 5-formyltetrahydrofolate cyclo-ligase [Staphylococcus edaphicus]UQW80322.1 5-formyltetrahydrofolate cyclo-ligase [Staphylococcus edaphicus]